MSLDIHIGTTEDKASFSNPLFSINENMHTDIFYRNRYIFIENNLHVFTNLLDFHNLYSPYIVHNNNFNHLRDEIAFLKLNMDTFDLRKEEKQQFIFLLDILGKIVKNDTENNIYFAFD